MLHYLRFLIDWFQKVVPDEAVERFPVPAVHSTPPECHMASSGKSFPDRAFFSWL